MNLNNKKVIITGATGGIGNSLVKKFSEAGAKILATGTKEDKLNILKKEFDNIQVEKFNLGEHSKIDPFIELANKTNGGVFILLKTSNPGSRDLQDLKVDGKKVFLHLSEKLSHIIESNLGKSGFSNVGIVVGATKPKEAILIRKALPKALFLIPGYGAQGAKASDALKGLINKNNVYEGGLINSSREILFPKGSYEQTNFSNWKNMIKFALDQTLRDLRYDPY